MDLSRHHRLLLVGGFDETNVGFHFRNAALKLGIDVKHVESHEAYDGNALWRRLNWALAGHRPQHLTSFSRNIVKLCREYRPTFLLTTGLAPIDRDALEEIGTLGVRRLNFLTDNPWNPAHRAPWFFRALPLYDDVFSPRVANLEDLRTIVGHSVDYVPFAYAPEVHFPETASAEVGAPDVFFAGGGDQDRIPLVEALLEAGLDVALYGHGWQASPITRKAVKGKAKPDLVRKLVNSSKISLCLVRRANRDGHSMRTYEAPAMNGCLLVENTDEHRALFGREGEAVLYFSDEEQLVGKAKALLASPSDRARLRASAHARITAGKNTYADRLSTILKSALLPRL